MAYRRKGMGQLNCPGDPGCPGYVSPSQNVSELLSGGMSPYDIYGYGIQSSGNTPYTAPRPGFTDWLNANSGKVAIGAAIFLGVMLFAKAGR
jgi:hypothetical protein